MSIWRRVKEMRKSSSFTTDVCCCCFRWCWLWLTICFLSCNNHLRLLRDFPNKITMQFERRYKPWRRISMDFTINVEIFITKCTDNDNFISGTKRSICRKYSNKQTDQIIIWNVEIQYYLCNRKRNSRCYLLLVARCTHHPMDGIDW